MLEGSEEIKIDQEELRGKKEEIKRQSRKYHKSKSRGVKGAVRRKKKRMSKGR